MKQRMEFWIVNWSGVPLFQYSPTEEINLNLISGFFSALQSFASELRDSSKKAFINSLTIGDFNYDIIINKMYQLYFISRSNVKMNTKKIMKHLQTIEEMFIKRYTNDLIGFDGDVSKFEKFKSQFEIYIKKNKLA